MQYISLNCNRRLVSSKVIKDTVVAEKKHKIFVVALHVKDLKIMVNMHTLVNNCLLGLK